MKERNTVYLRPHGQVVDTIIKLESDLKTRPDKDLEIYFGGNPVCYVICKH